KLRPDLVIHGVDLSPDMLDKARGKGHYDALFEADLTADISHLAGGYAALVSAGTFTLGHLGPEPLSPLLEQCLPGAMAIIGVNRQHFEAEGFEAVLTNLHDKGRISSPQLNEVQIFDGRDADHSGDIAFVLQFTVG
ncbi:MAG: methyltransferase, partial [Rhodospirillaceae bacterium]|nr:methyltransferase [Rhodospirillaceae bacterium]